MALSSDGAMAVLAPALALRTGLRVFAADACNLTSTEASLLADGLLGNGSTLESFSLSQNERLGADGARVLARALEGNSMLQRLHLSSCGIGSEGAAAVATAMADGGIAALRQLTLDRNALGDDGASALANALRTDSHVVAIDLSSNQIGAPGMSALATALTLNPETAVEDLWLKSNSAGDAGAEALAGLLRRNTKIRTLALWGNAISDGGGEAIERSLRQNRELEQLALHEHNSIRSEPLAIKLEAAAARNAEAHARGGAGMRTHGSTSFERK
jgi:Ran GTPase-activating protein (RanGAP) involved in mRNA processing and transport